MQWMKLIGITLAVGLLAVPLAAQSPGQSAPTEQTKFDIGGKSEKKHGVWIDHPPVEHPVPIPDDILKILRADQRVVGCLQQTGVTEAPATWFLASEIRLHANDQVDLVVLPVDECLFGVNIAPIWVFGKSARAYDLILRTETSGIEVLASRTNGYRDINAMQLTASDILTVRFNFDGQKYLPGKVGGRVKTK